MVFDALLLPDGVDVDECGIGIMQREVVMGLS